MYKNKENNNTKPYDTQVLVESSTGLGLPHYCTVSKMHYIGWQNRKHVCNSNVAVS